jgi:hypothetical protein
MRKVRNLALSAAIFALAVGVPFTGTAVAQPHPPMPPGMSAPDLHVRVVTEARPPLREEVRTERPGPSHFWAPGYWHHTGEAWAWNEGRWSEPRAHAHWVNASYKKVKGGTRYTPAHWSNEKVIYN